MNWFLVLLFWNPAIEGYEVADGWAPLPMPTFEICEQKLDYVKQYLPGVVGGAPHKVDCIQAEDQKAAIADMLDK